MENGFIVVNVGFYPIEQGNEKVLYQSEPDEVQFDLHSDTFIGALEELLKLWTDFCAENKIKDAEIDYVEQVPFCSEDYS